MLTVIQSKPMHVNQVENKLVWVNIEVQVVYMAIYNGQPPTTLGNN
jgi:hypothetical protein